MASQINDQPAAESNVVFIVENDVAPAPHYKAACQVSEDNPNFTSCRAIVMSKTPSALRENSCADFKTRHSMDEL